MLTTDETGEITMKVAAVVNNNHTELFKEEFDKAELKYELKSKHGLSFFYIDTDTLEVFENAMKAGNQRSKAMELN